MSEEIAKTWKWFLASVPVWGGDWLFEACDVDSPRALMESKHLTFRRQTKLQVEGKASGPQLLVIPYMPYMFGLIDEKTEGTMTGQAIASAVIVADDSPVVLEAIKQWTPQTVAPADLSTMKAEAERAEQQRKRFRA